MKVLVVNLLRLGDILMTAPVLKSLKEQNPNIILHVLVNKKFFFVKNIMPWVDKFYAFDRQQIQSGIGELERPILDPMDRLDLLIDRLNRNNYNKVINLTHNKLSGWFCDVIQCEEKLGLTLEQNGQYKFGSPWFSYLNDHVRGGSRDIAHMVDIFCYGSNLSHRARIFDFSYSSKDLNNSSKLVDFKANYICVQPLTSDDKKNWNFSQYCEALKIYKLLNPNTKIYILGAAYEADKLNSFLSICNDENVQVEIILCSLAEALCILGKSQLLLTGDTSIKHLACATDCKIIELSLGSGDYRKTGVYKPGSYIVASKETCYPCEHSENCFRESHKCAEKISPEAVAALMTSSLRGSERDISLLAKEYSDEINIYKTYFNHSGFWYAKNLGKNFSEKDLLAFVTVSSWKLLYKKEHLKLIGEYGSEGVKLRAAINQAFPEQNNIFKPNIIEQLEDKTHRKSLEINEIQDGMTKLIKSNCFPKELKERVVSILASEISPAVSKDVYSFLIKYDGKANNNFIKLRKYNELLKCAFDRNQIQLKLLRTLKSNYMETI